ncbi:MAG: MarR family winged helix-turn-helix transcriptional regulator [Bdellovibrionales bacterium]
MASSIFSDIGIAPIHAFVLMALSESKSLTPSEIADVLELDRSTVTRHLDVLQRKGFILKIKNGKIVNVTLKKQGKAMLSKIEKAWDDLYKKYCKDWGKAESDGINDLIYAFLNRL